MPVFYKLHRGIVGNLTVIGNDTTCFQLLNMGRVEQ